MSTFTFVPSSQSTPDVERAAILKNPGFGRYFTDHMARVTWSSAAGWHDGEVCALEPYEMHPSAAVLHYAQEIFEGLKAYRQPDGSVALFRPELNAARFVNSAQRLALPELPVQVFMQSVVELVKADVGWVPPPENNATLYIRPFMFAAEAFLGVRPADFVQYAVIASPAGEYFADGGAGITLWIDTEHNRAASGGTGAAKCGGNYAASLLPQVLAKKHGCDQVLYTIETGGERWIDESGTMNIFVITRDAELITPALGTILPGVTRATVLALAQTHDLTPIERPIAARELLARCEDGSVLETFASGTAAVITPITAIRGTDVELTVADGKPGTKTGKLRQHIVDLQFGRRDDDHGWLHLVSPSNSDHNVASATPRRPTGGTRRSLM